MDLESPLLEYTMLPFPPLGLPPTVSSCRLRGFHRIRIPRRMIKMTSLKDRLFYLASVSLALIAFILHLLARGEITRAQTLKAKNIEAAMNQQSAVVVDPAAKSLSDGGRMLNIVGVMFTVSGIICLILSA